MKSLYRYSFIFLFGIGLLAACSETRKRATDKLNELNQQAEELNSAVDDGFKKVESLDSVVRSGSEQLKQYDSLIKKNSSKIDSIAKEKAKAWEELTTY